MVLFDKDNQKNKPKKKSYSLKKQMYLHVPFRFPIEEFEVSDRLYAVISEAGFPTVGDLLLQMRLNPDSILGLNGMGPKAMKELTETLDKMFAVEEELEETGESELVAVVEDEGQVSEAELAEPEVIETEGEEIVLPEESLVSGAETVVAEEEHA